MLLRNMLRVLVSGLLVLGLSACSQAESIPPAEAKSGGVPSQGLPTLIDLGADKCIPCKMMAPILEELDKEYAGQMEVQFIDVWKSRDKAAAYGVQMIPTQIFYDETGMELFRRSGFIGKEDILAKWRELGYDFSK